MRRAAAGPTQEPDTNDAFARGRRHRVTRFGLLSATSLITVIAVVAAVTTWRADDTELVGPRPESEQGQIVFSRSGEGGGIMTMSAAGSEPELVASADFAPMDDPAWSPDGTRIAFHGFYGEARNQVGGLFVMNADGSNRRQLALGGDMPTWSPDGTKIAFYMNGQLYWIFAEGGAARPLAQGIEVESPDWSPDGSEITFSHAGLFIMSSNGGEPKKVVDGTPGTFPTDPRWSPDGTQIAFTGYIETPSDDPTQDGAEGANNELGEGVEDPTPMVSVLDISTGDIRRVTDGLNPTWSPDGTRLAFERIAATNVSHIYSINVDGTDLKQLTSGEVADHSPDWVGDPAPDCGQINLASDDYGLDFTRTTASAGTTIGVTGTTFRGEDGRWAAADRIEMWWNASTPEGHAIADGPVVELTEINEMDRCTFESRITIPDVPAGTYTVTTFVLDNTGYGIFDETEFVVSSATADADVCQGTVCLNTIAGGPGAQVTATVPTSGTIEDGVTISNTKKVLWWWDLPPDNWIDTVMKDPPREAWLLRTDREIVGEEFRFTFTVPSPVLPGPHDLVAVIYSEDGGSSSVPFRFDVHPCPELVEPGPTAEADMESALREYLRGRQPEESSGWNYEVERLRQRTETGFPQGDCPLETFRKSFRVEGFFEWPEGVRGSASMAYFRVIVGRTEHDWIVWIVGH